MIYSRSKLSRPKEVNRVQICDVNTSGVRRRAFAPVFLHVHAEKTDVGAVDLFKCEQRFRAVRKFARHVAILDKSTSHTGLDLDHLVAGRDNSDCDLTRTGFFLLQEIVHARLDVRAEFRYGQSFSVELILFAFLSLFLQAIITGESVLRDQTFE